MRCVETPVMSVIWNGKRLEKFKPSRGIRKGSAISPYNFGLCMEILGHLIHDLVTSC